MGTCPKVVPLTKGELNRHQRALAGKPNCAECPFNVNGAPNKPVLGVGGSKAIGLVLSEFPSKEEVEAGEPMTGLLGQQFDHILAGASLPREHLFLAPVIACRPNVERNDANLRAAAAACRPLLMSQLAKLAKDIPILAMGKAAYYSLTGKDKGVYLGRGFLRPFSIGG